MMRLTWSGYRDVAWYAIRRLFIAPAESDRCIMGYHEARTHCPRRVVDDEGLWCRVHLADWLGVR